MTQRVLGGGPLVDESTARQTVVSSGGRTFLLDEQASATSVTVAPSSGALVLHGQVPTVTTSVAVTPAAGVVVLNGQTPSVVISANVTPAAGVLTLVGHAPTVIALQPQQRFVPGPQEEHGHIHFPRFRTREEIRKARDELLGITPAAEKIVAEAAKQVIAKASRQDASIAPPDALAWLQEHQKQESAKLAAELKRRKVKADADQQRQFLILLGVEIQRELSTRREAEETRIRQQQEQDDEDIQIIALMLDM